MSMGGNTSESALTEGSVKGDEISFVETLKVQGQELRCEYKGKISGDEIRGPDRLAVLDPRTSSQSVRNSIAA